MSFSSEVKKEVGTINNLAKKEQLKYELIGYVLSSNCEVNKNKIKYATENDYNINRFSKILTNLQIEHDIQMSGNLFVINIKKVAIENIEEIKVNNENIEIAYIGKIQEENKKAIIRGMFLGSGSINNPQKKYHFEMSF